MSEESLWKWLKKRLPDDGHYTRIESDCSPGFPDVFYTLFGTSGTLELKFSKKPNAKYPLRGEIRKSQVTWHRSNLEVEGLGFVIAEVGDCVFVIHHEYLESMSQMDLTALTRASLFIMGKKELITVELKTRLEDLLTSKNPAGV